MLGTSPLPFVVRSTVESWITASLSSAVEWMSTSSMSEPSFIERSNAYIVAEGASSSPPWWVMLSVRSSIQSVGPAAAGAAVKSKASSVPSGERAAASCSLISVCAPHRGAILVRERGPRAGRSRARTPTQIGPGRE